MHSGRIGSLMILLLLVLSHRPLHAQLQSGPSVGNSVEALKAVAATGDAAGREVDFADERKQQPTIYIFIAADKWDRPVARFLKTLDTRLSNDHKDARIVAVWLTDDVEQTKDYLPKAQQSLKLTQTTLAVYPGNKNGPEGWGINPDAHLTAVVAQDRKVRASFGFRSVNETDVPRVFQELKPGP